MKTVCLECGKEFYDRHDESAIDSLRYHIELKHDGGSQ